MVQTMSGSDNLLQTYRLQQLIFKSTHDDFMMQEVCVAYSEKGKKLDLERQTKIISVYVREQQR